ncbi:MAG: hypothetical protein NVS3B26_18870 [Mycobacteriales bacterium]
MTVGVHLSVDQFLDCPRTVTEVHAGPATWLPTWLPFSKGLGGDEPRTKERRDRAPRIGVEWPTLPHERRQSTPANEWYAGDALTEPRQLRPDEAERAANGHVGLYYLKNCPDCVDLLLQASEQGGLVTTADKQLLDARREEAAGTAHLQRTLMGLGVDDPHSSRGDDEVVNVRSARPSVLADHPPVVQCDDVFTSQFVKLRRDGSFAGRALRPDPGAGWLVEHSEQKPSEFGMRRQHSSLAVL